MKRRCRTIEAAVRRVACGALLFMGTVEAAGLALTRLAWNAGTAKLDVSVQAAPLGTARTVWLAWDTDDRGDDFRSWARGEVLGTFAAGANSATFPASVDARFAACYRVFTFDAAQTTGDAYLSHVQATGAQSVDTGFLPGFRSAVWVDYNWNDTQGQQRVFSNSDDATGTFIFQHYISGTAAAGGSLAYACQDNKGNWMNYGNVVDRTRVALTLDSYSDNFAGRYRIERGGVAVCDAAVSDAVAKTARTLTAAPPKTLKLFSGATPSTEKQRGKLNLYRFKAWEAGELKLDLRPYVKGGVAGLLDASSGTFFASSLETALVAGTRLGAAALEASPAMARTDATQGVLASGAFRDVTELAASGAAAEVLVRDGTLKYAGADGARGILAGPVTFGTANAGASAKHLQTAASVFDVTGDLTLAGKVENRSGYGAFVKTGPGTLRIPGDPNAEWLWKLRGLEEANGAALGVFTPDPDGGSPTQGYTFFTLAEGRLVLGENGGKFRILRAGGADLQIGRLTVDPANPDGRQEADAVLEIAGGTTVITNWVNVGGKNGFSTTTPTRVPESGIRVTGGTLHCMASLTLGRNKNNTPQKDAGGAYIPQRTKPFLEVLGGRLQLWNTSRIGFCDDPGADSRVLVDTGTLYLCNANNTTGAGIILGQCSDGVATLSRRCDILVRNGGTFDCTDFYIHANAQNVTSDFRVVDGGIYRNNHFRKVNAKANCQQNLLFDGGIAEIRYAGNADWIASDVTKVAIGTRGATFRSTSGTTTGGMLNYVCAPLVAEATHPDEEPRGLTVTTTGTDRDAGFVLAAANAYEGPTTVTDRGRLELAGAGALPPASAVTLANGGRFAPTNAAHTVAGLTLGDASGAAVTLSLVAGCPLMAGTFAAGASAAVDFHLYSAPNAALAAAGSYPLIQAPAAALADLRRVAALAAWANAPAGKSAVFSAAVAGDRAVLSATVADAAAATDLHPAAGGTETVASFADAMGDGDVFRLGAGTLAYTGTGETVDGLVNCAGGPVLAALNVAQDLTLLDYLTRQGIFYKTGPGDLFLKGTGTFRLGNANVAYDAAKPQGFDADGNGPTHGLLGASVADGRLVIGVKDDPAHAPRVVAMNHIGAGVRTVARDSGKMETAGAIVMENGTLDASQLILGYYNGFDETTPAAGLNPTFTQNGGAVNLTEALVLGQDWQGNQACSPVFTLNGGTFTAAGNATIGFQPAKGRAGTVNAFTVNGGVFTCLDLVLGNVATAAKVTAAFNGGDVHCRNVTHTGAAASADKGYAEAFFNGTVFHLGCGRTLNQGFDFGSTDASKRLNAAFIGAGGFILDFDDWVRVGDDGLGINIRQPLTHDPACEGADGGMTIRGRVCVIPRVEANGSTFTGPVTLEAGAALGIDGNCDWFRDANASRPILAGPATALRLSAQLNRVGMLTLGAADATEPVTIDLCVPNAEANKGLVVTRALDVRSPVTVSFHRGGGLSLPVGTWTGTTDILLYPADQDANVSLDRFVPNPQTPEVQMTFRKETVISGTYAGYRKVVVTVTRATAGGTVWTSAAAGGAWADGANWQGGAPADGVNAAATFTAAASAAVPVTVAETPTVGRLFLDGADARKGYALTGAPIALANRAWNEAAGVVAVRGEQAVANDLVSSVDVIGESSANGGRRGGVALAAVSNATLTVTGAVTPHPSRDVFVNPPARGGGTVVLDGPVTAGTGVTVQSGTLKVNDISKLNGKPVTVGPGTFHYAGPAAATDSPLVFRSGATNLTAQIRVDDKLTVNGTVTHPGGSVGYVMKTGPGELVLAGAGANRLGGTGYNPDWNAIRTWPDNGDSYVMTSAAFCLDEGALTVGREGQFLQIGTGATDAFIGSQPRGWAYASDKVTFNMRGGALVIGYFGLGHGMRRGTDSAMSAPAYVEFNQYGGVVTNRSLYINYDLTKFDSHIRSTFNLYGGRFVTWGYVRLSQNYNTTGENEPSGTVNVHTGATWEFLRTEDDRRGNIFIPYSGSLSDLQKHRNRAPDGTLNLKGGVVENAYLIVLGQNGGRGEIHLDGGRLNCENIVHYPYAAVAAKSAQNQYRVYNVADGTANVYFNGGVFQPRGAMDQPKDALKGELWNATLTNLTAAVVEAGGARIDLSKLAAARYTLAQELTGGEGDGGLVKTGAKPLALAVRGLWHGETVVAQGTLLVTAAAPAGELLPNSSVRVQAGATLEFEAGARATVSKLVVDVARGGGTVKNLRVAPTGELRLENVTAERLSGLVIPLAFADTARATFAGWTTYVNGEKVEGALRPVYRDGVLRLAPPECTVLMLR